MSKLFSKILLFIKSMMLRMVLGPEQTGPNEYGSFGKAQAMVFDARKPIDLNGLDPEHKAWVMIARKDCPIDLSGLGSFEKARVIMFREDCPIDLSGLDSHHKAWVISV